MGLDPWVPGSPNGVPTLKLEHTEKRDWRVKNLILTTNNSCAWNDLIHEFSIPHRACLISSLPFPSLFIPCRWVWLDSNSGAFSVKKAYEINYRHPHLSSNFDFKKQWKAKLLPRLRLFGWRLFFNILPSADVLIARSISVTNSCVFCNNGD